MSFIISETMVPPTWFWELLGADPLADGERTSLLGTEYVLTDGVLRESGVASATQNQTSEVFDFKWHRRETFESDASLQRMREWLIERYGDVACTEWWNAFAGRPIVLDAGCGAALSALELFRDVVQDVRYVGIDISAAVDVAAARFSDRGVSAAFMQADITKLPLTPGSIDLIFSEGVLHHTDSTEEALHALAPLLRPGGRFLFYVYRRKGPIREFTDDYVRERLGNLAPADAWETLKPVSLLGEALGRLGVEIDVPADIDLLGIPAGPIDLQRLFYWHVLKAFFREDLTFEEMHHINYDWFAPANARRQSPAEVRTWCEEAGLEIERENVQDSGITIIARKR